MSSSINEQIQTQAFMSIFVVSFLHGLQNLQIKELEKDRELAQGTRAHFKFWNRQEKGQMERTQGHKRRESQGMAELVKQPQAPLVNNTRNTLVELCFSSLRQKGAAEVPRGGSKGKKLLLARPVVSSLFSSSLGSHVGATLCVQPLTLLEGTVSQQTPWSCFYSLAAPSSAMFPGPQVFASIDGKMP